MKAQAEEHKQHGHAEGGCDASKKAKGVKSNTIAEQIAEQRKMIKEREAKEGKAYLSYYYVVAKTHSAK